MQSPQKTPNTPHHKEAACSNQSNEPADKQQKHMEKGYKLLLLITFIGALGYLLLSFWVGWDKVKNAITHVGLSGISYILALSLLSIAVRFIKWQIYLKKLEAKLPLFKSLRIYVGGYSMTATPGKAGEAIRSIFLKKYGVSYSKSLAMFFSDILVDLIAMLLLATVGIWTYSQGWLFGSIVLLGISLILFIIYKPNTYSWFINKASKIIPWKKPIHLLQHTLTLLRHCNIIFQPSTLVAVLGLSLIAWTIEAYILHYVAILLLANITFTTTVFVYAFSKLVGALSMIPGGLGSVEATLIGLLVLNGVDEVTAITCAILLRVVTFWLHILLGIVAMPKR